MLEPRKYAGLPIKILNVMDTVLMFFSIAGLVIEFSVYNNNTVVKAGQMLDIYFFCSFVFRFFSFPARKYLFKDYGWLDLIGALPCLLMLTFFQPVRQFISAFIYGGLAGMLLIFRLARIFCLARFVDSRYEYLTRRMKKISSPIIVAGIVLVIFTGYYMGRMPDVIRAYYYYALPAMILTVILSVMFVNMYVRKMLKDDLKVMNLIIDSIDAGEYGLLKNFAYARGKDDPDHDELAVLLKLTSSLVDRMEDVESVKYLFNASDVVSTPGQSFDLERIDGMLKNKSVMDEDYVKRIIGTTSLHTVKLSAKMIMDILKKNGK
jgi:hypothetical protein